MPQVDDVDNQLVDVDVDSDGTGGNPDGSNDSNEDFLVVNERTRFKSQEDAIKSFNEAGSRIAELSQWEKELKERYGVADPQSAGRLLQELIQLREEKAALAKEQKESASKQNTAVTRSDEDEVLSKEDADALKWLRKFAPRLGYVPQAELTKTVEDLKAELKTLQDQSAQSSTRYQEEQRSQLVDSGRESVLSLMAGDRIVDNADGDKIAVIEGLIRDWVNADNSRVERFYAGAASSKALVKEGYDRAVKVLGWKTSASSSGSTSYAQSKGAALARNGKRMPQNGVSNKQSKNNASDVRTDAGGKKDFIGSAHNKAWDIASKHFSGTSSE